MDHYIYIQNLWEVKEGFSSVFKVIFETMRSSVRVEGKNLDIGPIRRKELP